MKKLKTGAASKAKHAAVPMTKSMKAAEAAYEEKRKLAKAQAEKKKAW